MTPPSSSAAAAPAAAAASTAADSTASPRGPLVGGRPHEECGVCAVSGHPEAAALTYLGLYAQQHRGQETAGIVTAWRRDDGKVRHLVHRGLGRVGEVFDAATLERLTGPIAIGHVRYSTTGQPIPANTQPLASSLRFGPVALAHNGNLVNARALRAELKARGALFQTSIDSEVILHLLSHAPHADFELALRDALARIEGAFSLVMLHGDRLYAVRDPRGFRPLVLGRLRAGTRAWVVASETVAFDLVDAERVRDVEPGEVVRLDPDADAPVSLALQEPRPAAHCIFELIYFSRPDSVIDGRDVQEFRERLGRVLWREAPADADLVVPVPDSSTAAAIGYAEEGGLPFRIGLIRSHYIGRTFIEPTQRIRDFRSRLKYNANRSLLDGRRVVIVDDSIVRGTTSRRIVRMLRDAGAREIHLRVTSPPWRHACFYGIDTPDEKDLLAHGSTIDQMRDDIGCDSLGFLSADGLFDVARQRDGWCTACFTGAYPTDRPAWTSKEELVDDSTMLQHEPAGHAGDTAATSPRRRPPDRPAPAA